MIFSDCLKSIGLIVIILINLLILLHPSLYLAQVNAQEDEEVNIITVSDGEVYEIVNQVRNLGKTKFIVKDGGTLIIKRSTLRNTLHPRDTFIYIDSGGKVYIQYSKIYDWGNIRIYGQNSNLTIRNSLIDGAISVKNYAYVYIYNTKLKYPAISGSYATIYIEKSSWNGGFITGNSTLTVKNSVVTRFHLAFGGTMSYTGKVEASLSFKEGYVKLWSSLKNITLNKNILNVTFIETSLKEISFSFRSLAAIGSLNIYNSEFHELLVGNLNLNITNSKINSVSLLGMYESNVKANITNTIIGSLEVDDKMRKVITSNSLINNLIIYVWNPLNEKPLNISFTGLKPSYYRYFSLNEHTINKKYNLYLSNTHLKNISFRIIGGNIKLKIVSSNIKHIFNTAEADIKLEESTKVDTFEFMADDKGSLTISHNSKVENIIPYTYRSPERNFIIIKEIKINLETSPYKTIKKLKTLYETGKGDITLYCEEDETYKLQQTIPIKSTTYRNTELTVPINIPIDKIEIYKTRNCILTIESTKDPEPMILYTEEIKPLQQTKETKLHTLNLKTDIQMTVTTIETEEGTTIYITVTYRIKEKNILQIITLSIQQNLQKHEIKYKMIYTKDIENTVTSMKIKLTIKEETFLHLKLTIKPKYTDQEYLHSQIIIYIEGDIQKLKPQPKPKTPL